MRKEQTLRSLFQSIPLLLLLRTPWSPQSEWNWRHQQAQSGCSSMVELRLPKPTAWVRFPSPAPSSFQPLENKENLTNIGVGGCRNGYTNGYSINFLDRLDPR